MEASKFFQLSKSVGKVMCIICFNTTQIILSRVVPEKQAANGGHNAEILWSNLQQALHRKRPDLLKHGGQRSVLCHSSCDVHLRENWE